MKGKVKNPNGGPNFPPIKVKRDNIRAILFNMPEHMIQELDVLSKFKGTNRTALINIVLSDWINQELNILTANGRIEDLDLYQKQAKRIEKLKQDRQAHYKTLGEKKDSDIRHTILGDMYDD
jgi:plasmid maintenance system killer protein|tara:strand:+ start:637 stop:1002 length:366 start_codon:yes stop_codon:yes gene_type:complete